MCRLVGVVERFAATADVGATARLAINADKLKLRVLEVTASDVSTEGVQFTTTGTGNQVRR